MTTPRKLVRNGNVVVQGLYFDEATKTYFERPFIRGKRTWRALDGHTARLAKESMHQRRAQVSKARVLGEPDPYDPKMATVGQLIDSYPPANKAEKQKTKFLRGFWGSRVAKDIRVLPDAKSYFDFRKRTISKKRHGGRSVDLELVLLRKILRHGAQNGDIEAAPTAEWPSFRAKGIKHCRDSAPDDAKELHKLAYLMFEDRRSEVLGWQLLVTAMTGCRTSEVLRLRWDAKRRQEPGFIEDDWLWLCRSKGGVNPFAKVTPELKACLEAMAKWRLTRPYALRSPWMFPSIRAEGQAVHETSLAHALMDGATLAIGRHVTPHGLRSYYVTARRSQGTSDAQIAAEIGDKSGPSIIASTYGSIPPDWRGGDGIGWVPTKGELAWSIFGPTKKESKKESSDTHRLEMVEEAKK